MSYNRPQSNEAMLKQLKDPFDPRFVKVRVGAMSKDKKKAIALFYIDSREIQKRLDEVCGIGGWSSKMIDAKDGVICALSIRMPNGEWVTKTDGGEYSKVSSFKGACSDALKRAAVQFGVGRYLYYIPNQWYPLNEYKTFDNQPSLPKWALPNPDIVDWETIAELEYDQANDIDIENYNPDEELKDEIISKSNARKQEILKAAMENKK